MTFYVLLLLPSIALVFLSQFLGKSRSQTVCIYVTLVLGIVASLRGYVGTDTYSYHLQFEWIADYQELDAGLLLNEPAFVVIAKLVDLFGGNSFAYVSVIGILQMLLLMFVLRRIERPALFLMFYIATFYIVFHFNIIRASTALLIILISLIWIKEGGAKFLITLWSSVLFHYTAILFVVYVLIYKQFVDKKYVRGGLLVLATVVATVAVMSMISSISFGKYDNYLEQDFAANRDLGIGLLLLLTLYLGLGLTIFQQKKLDVMFFVLPLVLIKILIVYYPILSRLESFLLPMFLLVLTKDIATGWRRELSALILIVLSLLNINGSLASLPIADAQPNDLEHSYSPYIPYHTLWEAK